MTNAVSGLSAALYKDEPEEYVVTPALGSNRDICFVSKNHATNSVEIIVSGTETELSVSVSGSKLTINSATDDADAASSTAADIVKAVNEDAGAAALFLARLPPGSTGAGKTGALTETAAAAGVAETALAMVDVDSVDHKIFQAAQGSRYWDPSKTFKVYIDSVESTSGWVVNYLQGKVTFATDQSGKTITVGCTRRPELAYKRVLLIYDGKMKIQGKEIDTSNIDDDGWGSTITGAKTWEMNVNAYYYPEEVTLAQLGVAYIWKFYSIDGTQASGTFTGWGSIQSIDELIANPDKAQENNITVKGRGELYPET